MKFRNCSCKTNSVLVNMAKGEEIVRCLRCKEPYNFTNVSYGLKMPFKWQTDGTCHSEVVINSEK